MANGGSATCERGSPAPGSGPQAAAPPAEQKTSDLGAHSVTPSTFEWQARGFYIKQGYEEFGHIDNYIQGFQLVYLKKSRTA